MYSEVTEIVSYVYLGIVVDYIIHCVMFNLQGSADDLHLFFVIVILSDFAVYQIIYQRIWFKVKNKIREKHNRHLLRVMELTGGNHAQSEEERHSERVYVLLPQEI